MREEKRRSRRQSVARYAWIDLSDGSPPLKCVLGNMSDTGAKLIVDRSVELPAEFVLRLSADGRVARKCRLAWIKDLNIGVQFTARRISNPPL
jgi:hypothetical protein